MPAVQKRTRQGSERRLAARAEITERKQTLVRDEILMAAARLFSDKGYRAVTMDDVAASLGYTKSVLYYYFKNKNDILWQIFLRSFESYSQDVRAAVDDTMSNAVALSNMVRQHALNVMRNPEWAAIYNGFDDELNPVQQRQLGKLKREYNAMFLARFEAGVSEGAFREMPPFLAISGMLGMCNWLHTWYEDKGPFTIDQIADNYVALLASGYQAN